MSELLYGILNNGGFMNDDREIRLWDGQWMNIVNHEHCWERYTKEEAIHAAVKMTEEKMAENMMLGKWPKRRDAVYRKQIEELQAKLKELENQEPVPSDYVFCPEYDETSFGMVQTGGSYIPANPAEIEGGLSCKLYTRPVPAPDLQKRVDELGNAIAHYKNDQVLARDTESRLVKQIEELQARIAMQDEVLREINEYIPVGSTIAVLSATSADIAAWQEKRDKEVAAKAKIAALQAVADRAETKGEQK